MAPTDVRTIHVPYPEATDRELRITADACHIHLQPGAGEEWVSGTYQDPSGQRSPTLTMDGGTLTIDHHRTTRDLTGELVAGDPVFDLLLGTRQPYALTIQAAAIQSDAPGGRRRPTDNLPPVIGPGAGRGLLLLAYRSPSPAEGSGGSLGPGRRRSVPAWPPMQATGDATRVTHRCGSARPAG